MVEMKVTDEWQLKAIGENYNDDLNLYSIVDKNERFYAGDQWAGVNAGGLDTPVFNIFKRAINYFIASMLSQNLSIQYSAELVGDEPTSEAEQEIIEASALVSAYSETLKEKLRLPVILRQSLLDSALSGDACTYVFWNELIDNGQDVKGEIDMEMVDNVNVMFGNPNDRRVNHNGKPIQPYILLIFRQSVDKLRKEAKRNGVSAKEIALISGDKDNDKQSGDRGKIELEGSELSDKTTAVIKLWVDGDTIKAKKSTKFCPVRPEWDTKLSLYPVAWMNWDVRKNSYHGQAVGTGLIPNQIFINKAFAMLMLWVRQMSIPKVIYDRTRIAAWSSKIGAAIGVDGDINSAAQYMAPSQISNMIIKVIDMAMQYTKDLIGATDAALGQVRPDNTSAILAVQQASAIPLENIKANLYQYVEDIAEIWMDFMASYYGKRKVGVTVMGKREVKEFDFSKLKKMHMRIKIDVGPSSYWSEIASMQTLDRLLQVDKINFIQYLKRVPNGIIPDKIQLIKELEAGDTKRAFIYEQMAKWLENQPEEVRARMTQLSPEQMEESIMRMMMEVPNEGSQMPQMQQVAG